VGFLIIRHRARRKVSVREHVYIYASLKPGKAEEFDRMHIHPGDLPTGVLVGTVEITDCSGARGLQVAFSATAAIAASSSAYEAPTAGLVQSVLASFSTGHPLDTNHFKPRTRENRSETDSNENVAFRQD
jgi:hypothetical protein